MPRSPRVTGSQVLRALQRAGWRPVRQVGSHVHLAHPARPGRVTIPVHAGETLAPKTLASILAQSGLTMEELRNLL